MQAREIQRSTPRLHISRLRHIREAVRQRRPLASAVFRRCFDPDHPCSPFSDLSECTSIPPPIHRQIGKMDFSAPIDPDHHILSVLPQRRHLALLP
jgi:hypothetical protein